MTFGAELLKSAVKPTRTFGYWWLQLGKPLLGMNFNLANAVQKIIPILLPSYLR